MRHLSSVGFFLALIAYMSSPMTDSSPQRLSAKFTHPAFAIHDKRSGAHRHKSRNDRQESRQGFRRRSRRAHDLPVRRWNSDRLYHQRRHLYSPRHKTAQVRKSRARRHPSGRQERRIGCCCSRHGHCTPAVGRNFNCAAREHCKDQWDGSGWLDCQGVCLLTPPVGIQTHTL